MRDRGFSITKFVLVLVAVVVIGSLALKITPHYLEFKRLKKTFEGISNSNTLVNANPKVVFEQLKQQATLNKFTYDADLVVLEYNETKHPILSISYDKLVPLISNISLELHFETGDQTAATPNPLAAASDAAKRMNEQLKEQEKALQTQ